MRIGMILDEVFPPDPRVENEAVSLIKSGHEVFLFCLQYDSKNASEVIKGINVKRYLSNKLEYKLSALAYTFPFYKILMSIKIKDFIVKNKIDVIHTHDIRIAAAVFKANKKIELPIILDLHENRPEIMKYYPHLSKFPGNFLISPNTWKKKEEQFILKATKIVVVTALAKKEILNRLPINDDKVIVLPNTVRKSFYENSIKLEFKNKYSNHFTLLYIGDTGLRRGLETAIKAIAILKNKIPNIKLVIVGKNTTDFVLKELTQKLNIEKFVDFLGWQDQKYFKSLINSSDVCISPLHRNLHHDTTYANKIFQYMSLRKPLLVSDATAQKEIVERVESGLVHQAKNVEDFAEKALILYKNESLRSKLAENGEGFVKDKFNWETTSASLIKLYENILN